MMGVPPDQAKRLTIWEFTAMREVWNDRHKTEDADDDITLPTEEFVLQRHEELRKYGIPGSNEKVGG